MSKIARILMSLETKIKKVSTLIRSHFLKHTIGSYFQTSSNKFFLFYFFLIKTLLRSHKSQIKNQMWNVKHSLRAGLGSMNTTLISLLFSQPKSKTHFKAESQLFADNWVPGSSIETSKTSNFQDNQWSTNDLSEVRGKKTCHERQKAFKHNP